MKPLVLPDYIISVRVKGYMVRDSLVLTKPIPHETITNSCGCTSNMDRDCTRRFTAVRLGHQNSKRYRLPALLPLTENQ